MTDSKVKSNADVAHEIMLSGESRYFDPTLADKIEAALSTAQSELAQEVLADVNVASGVLPSPSGEYQQGMKDGFTAISKRLRGLFTRLGIKVEE